MFKILFVLQICLCLLLNYHKITAKLRNRELELVHIIFRHGARTPADTYPTDPFLNEPFYPDGWGHLTKAGKRQMYDNGIFMRKRYDKFLGDIYSDKIVYAGATDSDRTISSTQLMCAAIWPPSKEQKWGPLNWQPIPVRSEPLNEDNLLLVRKPCAQYHIELDRVMSTGDVRYRLFENRRLFYTLSAITGLQIKTFDDIQSLYSTLRAESGMNLTLPTWTREYYPAVLEPLTEYSYVVNAYTNKLKRLKGGVLLKKLLVDWHQVANTTIDDTYSETNSSLLELLRSKEWIKEASDYGPVTSERKLYLFGGHDSTITNLLSTLDVWDMQNPDYGITVMFELSRNLLTMQHEVQVFLKNETYAPPHLLVIPGCFEFCPLSRLTEIVDPVIPRNWTEECYDTHFVPPELGGP